MKRACTKNANLHENNTCEFHPTIKLENYIRMKENEIKNCLEGLIELFEEKRVYLIKDITPRCVARMLGKRRCRLDHILDASTGLSLDQMIVMYRVQHARRLLLIGMDYECLWELSGFTSTEELESALERIVV